MAHNNITVAVRCRPFLSHESNKPSVRVSGKSIVSLAHDKVFTFDSVFDINSTQRDVYKIARHLVHKAFDGLNGCVFAYGQTSSGKTHTIIGDLTDPEQRGIIPRVTDEVFDVVEKPVVGSQAPVYLLMVSFVEIYNEQLTDLLKPEQQLRMRENKDEFFVEGLTKVLCESREGMISTFLKGLSNRRVRATSQNDESSRSHCIFSVFIEKNEVTGDGVSVQTRAQLNLVDLAGSERIEAGSNDKVQKKEGCEINLSLSCLARVISTLAKTSGTPSSGRTRNGKRRKNFVPYRDSVLTKLLKNSLGGNSNTVMLAAINPSSKNANETLSTLKYAQRAKFIKNKVVVNQDPRDMLITKLQQEIAALRDQLKNEKSSGSPRLLAPLVLQSDSTEALKLLQDVQFILSSNVKSSSKSNSFQGFDFEMDTKPHRRADDVWNDMLTKARQRQVAAEEEAKRERRVSFVESEMQIVVPPKENEDEDEFALVPVSVEISSGHHVPEELAVVPFQSRPVVLYNEPHSRMSRLVSGVQSLKSDLNAIKKHLSAFSLLEMPVEDVSTQLETFVKQVKKQSPHIKVQVEKIALTVLHSDLGNVSKLRQSINRLKRQQEVVQGHEGKISELQVTIGQLKEELSVNKAQLHNMRGQYRRLQNRMNKSADPSPGKTPNKSLSASPRPQRKQKQVDDDLHDIPEVVAELAKERIHRSRLELMLTISIFLLLFAIGFAYYAVNACV